MVCEGLSRFQNSQRGMNKPPQFYFCGCGVKLFGQKICKNCKPPPKLSAEKQAKYKAAIEIYLAKKEAEELAHIERMKEREEDKRQADEQLKQRMQELQELASSF